MKFDGIYSPVITPHREDGSIDRDAMAAQIEYLIASGVHGLINGGSTGEYYAQSLEERMEIASFVKDVIGDNKTYVTFDIDCLDPAFAPGTGTPVSGGLNSAQALHILRDLKGLNMVGGDVVEVSPPFDVGNATAVAGAHIATELMCLY